MESGLEEPQMRNTSGDESLMEMGAGLFGCSHYRRRCKIRAPCCDEIFDCRHCHNESKNSLEVDPLNRHDIPRHELKRVICSLCLTEQDVSFLLKKFGATFNTSPSKLWQSNANQISVKVMRWISRFQSSPFRFNKNAFSVGFAWGSIIAQNANFLMMMQVFCLSYKKFMLDCGYNCLNKNLIFISRYRRINTTVINVESAGIIDYDDWDTLARTMLRYFQVPAFKSRTGGGENFFHCNKCGCCYSRLMKDTHICVERAMHHNCPVCFEYLFDTTKDMTVLSCGHTIHLQCVKEMEQRFQYSCPVCSKSYCDMSRVWLKLDQEVASMPMPEMYENKMVWILCNDCGETSEVNFHIVAHKCTKCTSYNTRRTRGGPTSCSSRVEMAR